METKDLINWMKELSVGNDPLDDNDVLIREEIIRRLKRYDDIIYNRGEEQ